MIRAVPALPVLTVPAWREIAGLEHGFLTRRGGTSSGHFAELNLSSNVGDAAAEVAANWAKVRSHVDDRLQFVTMVQVHGARVFEVTSLSATPGEADALVSSIPAAGLSVLTADCVPILLAAPRVRIVAAVHAGWRGTLAGVVVAAVTQMRRTSGGHCSEISAALGPAIGSCCYEVDAAIADDIESRWGTAPAAVRRYTREGRDKARLDLRAVNAKMLLDAGLDAAAVSFVGGCTCCGSGDFFSHRATNALGAGGVTGRQLSFIGWVG